MVDQEVIDTAQVLIGMKDILSNEDRLYYQRLNLIRFFQLYSTKEDQIEYCHPCGDTETRKQMEKSQCGLLHLLRHSSKCPFSKGYCPTSSILCWGGKLLWQHSISDNCGDQSCEVTQCQSSRFVLAHYIGCSNRLLCNVCGPMCVTIRKNVERFTVSEIIIL